MEYFVIYLLVMSADLAAGLQSLGGTVMQAALWLIGLTACWLFAAIVVSVEGSFESKEERDAFKVRNSKAVAKAIKWFIALMILAQILKGIAVLTPEPKQLAMIIGGGAVYNALTSDTATNLADKITAKLQERIDQALEADASKPE